MRSKAVFVVFASAMLHGGQALAEKNINTTYECKNGKLVREVHMALGVEQSGDYGCSVIYRKITEIGANHSQELWTAPKGKDYCAEKMTGFVEKLKGLGWTCVKT